MLLFNVIPRLPIPYAVVVCLALSELGWEIVVAFLNNVLSAIFCFIPDWHLHLLWNRIGSVMISLLASRTGRSLVRAQSSLTKDYAIAIWCISQKHTSWRTKSRDLLSWNQGRVSNSEVYSRTVVSRSYHYKIPTNFGLVQSTSSSYRMCPVFAMI